MAQDQTVLEMVGEYLRELSVLVLVFFPLELSKATDSGFSFNRPLMRQVAEFSIVTWVLGVIFGKWLNLATFFTRAWGALRKEFGQGHEVAKEADDEW